MGKFLKLSESQVPSVNKNLIVSQAALSLSIMTPMDVPACCESSINVFLFMLSLSVQLKKKKEHFGIMVHDCLLSLSLSVMQFSKVLYQTETLKFLGSTSYGQQDVLSGMENSSVPHLVPSTGFSHCLLLCYICSFTICQTLMKNQP